MDSPSNARRQRVEIMIMRIPYLIVALFIASLLIVIGFFGYAFIDIQGRDHVADAVLASNLERDTEKYNLLIKMFHEDSPITVVHPTWIDPNVISQKRWEEYKKLFIELGLDGGMRSWGGGSIWFISTAQGLVTGGSSKGYMYKPENPIPLYQNLDERPQDLPSNVKAYKRINDEWYIVFDWDD